MSGYRKEWPCCGDETYTEAWGPERCPFCELNDAQDRIAELETELEAARAQQSGQGREDAKERLREAISEALGEALDCTRVWEAWGYSTMSQDDFQPVNDDPDRLEELVDAALSVLPLPSDKPEGEWVKCSERLPTEDDADALRQIWIYSDVLGVLPLSKDSFSEPPFYTHWMPTGLTRPAAPDMGGEK